MNKIIPVILVILLLIEGGILSANIPKSQHIQKVLLGPKKNFLDSFAERLSEDIRNDDTFESYKSTIASRVTVDNNGNLTHFNHDYVYNWKNQLVRVTTGTGVNVEYKYDALGRRIVKKVKAPNSSDTVTRYVHDGYQVIEERNGSDQVTYRYTYGNGIDERIEIEKHVKNQDGTYEWKIYLPLHDSIGNVTALTNDKGHLIERYNYSPYGEVTYFNTESAPGIDYVRIKDGVIRIKFDRPVDPGKIYIHLYIKSTQQVISGNKEYIDIEEIGYRTSTLPTDEMLTLNLKNQSGPGEPIDIFSQDFIYQGQADVIVHDGGKPYVKKEVQVENNIVIIFNEEIDPDTTTYEVELEKNNIKIDGTLVRTGANEYKFFPSGGLVKDAQYMLRMSGFKDLLGNAMDDLEHSFVSTENNTLIFEYSILTANNHSIVGNTSLLHGRDYEPEIGLYYLRNRYYHPQLGRFLQQDPMGYEDSLNTYQAFGMNPVNFTDPLGLKTDFNYFGTKKSFSQALNSLVVTAADKRQLGRMAEGGANLIPSIIYLIQDLAEVVTGEDYFEDDWRFRFNFSEPGSTIQIYSTENRTYWEKVRDATVVYPTGKFLADTGSNFILGYNDPYVMNTPLGQEARENFDRQLIPLGVTAYGVYKGISSRSNTPIPKYASENAKYQFDMMNPGPLSSMPSNPAANFFGGMYNTIILESDLILYRAGKSGGGSNALGKWFTWKPSSSVAKVRIDSAVKAQWIDAKTGILTGESVIESIYAIKIPKGTKIYEGPVGYQSGVYLGGVNMTQIFIPEPWNIRGLQVLKEESIK
jgi:RHS repeat-associated protein